jgi:hypothetical protein
MIQKLSAEARPSWRAQLIGRRAASPVAGNRGRILNPPRKASVWEVGIWQVAIVVAIFGLWELGARMGWVNTFFWSQPSQIWDKALVFVQ